MRKAVHFGGVAFVAWVYFAACVYVTAAAGQEGSGQEGAKSAPAESSATAAVAMPADAKELMALAAKSNGLTGPDMKPWHLKVSFKTFDDTGQMLDQGTMEEFWAGEQKYKTVFDSGSFSAEGYGTPGGRMVANVTGQPQVILDRVLTEFVRPFPESGSRGQWVLEAKQRDMGEIKLMCLAVTGLTAANGPVAIAGPMYCLDDNRPILRLGGGNSDGTVFLHNGIRVFHGQYFPGDIQVLRNGKSIVEAHVEKLELMTAVNDDDFAPPANAVLSMKKIVISAGVAQAYLVKSVQPDYPVGAKAHHVQGTVVIRATIGTDGNLSDMSVVGGPDELRQAALDAVKKWIYRPYLLNGEAVVVDTNINVAFNLTAINVDKY